MENLFNKLEFQAHPNVPGGKIARMYFDNGFGASVVGGGCMGLHGDGHSSFEVAVIKGSGNDFTLVYDTHITEDVLNYQSPEEVNDILYQIKELV